MAHQWVVRLRKSPANAPGQVDRSRNREVIASVGRAAKNHRVALILFDRRPQARSATANMELKS